MPEAIMFHYQGKAYTIYFARPNAVLPVVSITGEITLLPWGRRQNEKSDMPLGGWARLSAIHDGKWSVYSPKPVRLPVEKFMQTDYEGHTHWYAVTRSQYFQGLLARVEEEYRVYIVTIVPELLDISHERWPRIISRSVYCPTMR